MAKDISVQRTSSYLDEEEKGPVIPGENKKLDSSADVADIIARIKKCEGLNTLRLSGNSFGVGACEAIGEALSNIPTIKRLLWSDMFVSRLTDEIPRSLTSLGNGVVSSGAQLVELDLSDNAFGLAGVKGIVTLLTSSAAFTIKVLRFNNNGLGIGGGKALAKALEDCYNEAQQAGARFALEVFVAGRNRLENDGATALAAVFEMVGTLVHVSMPQNGITAGGIAALAQAFGKNPNLQIIDLNDNTFTQEGACAMAKVLPNLQQLRVINFGDCLVRPGGAVAIAEAIQDGHKLLEELNLSFCELNTDAGTAIINALNNKQDLKKVDLNGNCFGEEGVETIKEMLESKGHLEVLGTLSDDEGEESGEEEGNTTREEGEESEGSEGGTEDSKCKDGDDEEGGGSDGGSEGHGELGSDTTITIEEYFAHPSGENLVALGSRRAQTIAKTLGSNPSADGIASLYCKVTSCYTGEEYGTMKKALEDTIDSILKQPFESNSSALLNAILVQVGLIKSENKAFKGLKEVDGPLMALEHVIKRPYFSREAEAILTAFVNKPSPVLDKRVNVRDKLLRALMSV